MEKVIIIFVILILMLILIFYMKSNFEVEDILTYPYFDADKKTKQNIMMIKNPDSDIKLEPYGCFEDLSNNFFLKKMNPFKENEFDSGMVITDENSFKEVQNKVKENGFVYPITTSFKDTPLQKIAALAVLSGYSYLSVFSNEGSYFKIYLTYSPPMDKHNIYGNYSDKEYKRNLSKIDFPDYKLINNGKDEICGYKCKDSDYACGSINYPGIKTLPRVAVYKLIETV